MSRSSDAHAGRHPRSRRLVLIGSVLLGVSVCPGVAVAEDTTPVIPHNGPAVTIVAPVLDLQLGESDLRNEARIEQLPKRTTVTLDSTILFPKDSAKLNPRALTRLSEVAKQLKQRGPGSVRVTGYTDDLGSAARGLTLSRQRAQAVTAVLRRDLSGAAFPFTVVGKGEADPAVPNTSEANRKINRRVVLIYERR